MQFFQTLALLVALAVPAFATYPVVYDTLYDEPTTSLQATACSTGENGLLEKYPTFGDIPNYPFIGGAFAVEGFNSTKCGSCWELTYTGQLPGKENIIHLTAVNTAPAGFVSSLQALEALTALPREQIENIQVEAKQVHRSFCGL